MCYQSLTSVSRDTFNTKSTASAFFLKNNVGISLLAMRACNESVVTVMIKGGDGGYLNFKVARTDLFNIC